jgi:hypothetical protein
LRTEPNVSAFNVDLAAEGDGGGASIKILV